VVAMNKIGQGQTPNPTRSPCERSPAGLQEGNGAARPTVIRCQRNHRRRPRRAAERLALETEVLELKSTHLRRLRIVIEAKEPRRPGASQPPSCPERQPGGGRTSSLAGHRLRRVRKQDQLRTRRSRPPAQPSGRGDRPSVCPRPRRRFQVLARPQAGREDARAPADPARTRTRARPKVTPPPSRRSPMPRRRRSRYRQSRRPGSLELLNKTIAALSTDEVRRR